MFMLLRTGSLLLLLRMKGNAKPIFDVTEVTKAILNSLYE
jgi:hypothetical protein